MANVIYRYCGIIAVILATAGVEADSIAPAADMHIKPKLCIRGTSAEQCQLDVDISWQSNDISEYCLYSEQSPQPLHCWAQQAQGTMSDTVSIQKDLDYWLAWQINNDELARNTLRVLTAKPDDRRQTRRRRHVWSVF